MAQGVLSFKYEEEKKETGRAGRFAGIARSSSSSIHKYIYK